MLVSHYRKEFRRPPNPKAEHLRCVAYLDEDISEVLPYLNRVLDGHQYFPEPPSLTLKLPGKLVTLRAKEVAINILEDEGEADRILEWLKEKINETWRERERIEPRFTAAPKPRLLDILRLLPKTNCGKCGDPTCMVFARRLSERTARPEDCPALDEQHSADIRQYLEPFRICGNAILPSDKAEDRMG
jgi:ArsR family metal-binding transcriptional regulator